MNDDKLKEEAVRWLSSLRESAEHAREFVLDQAPDTIRELVTLGRVESTVFMAIGTILACLCLRNVARFKEVDIEKSPDEDDNPKNLVIGFIGIVFGIVSVIVLSANFHRFTSAWFAPRIYIIETLAELIGKMAGGKP